MIVFIYKKGEKKKLIILVIYQEFKRKKREEEEEKKRKEEEERKKREGESFIESFENHKVLWISLFAACFTTLLGIIGIIVLICKIHRIKHPR